MKRSTEKRCFCHTRALKTCTHSQPMKRRLSHRQHTLTTWWAVPLHQRRLTEVQPGSQRLSNSITLPVHEALPDSNSTFASLFPAKHPGHLSPSSPTTTSLPCAFWWLSSVYYSLAAARTTPVYTSYLQLITWGASPKIKQNYSRFSGVKLCLCSW